MVVVNLDIELVGKTDVESGADIACFGCKRPGLVQFDDMLTDCYVTGHS